MLVSSKTCPFVQRAVILLLEKRVEHEVTYIDLASKPQWFLDKSPRGKVPLLMVEGATLFESQAICEYLDETRGEAEDFEAVLLEFMKQKKSWLVTQTA